MKLPALLLLFVTIASETALAQADAGKSHGPLFSITIRAVPSSVIQARQKFFIEIALTNLSDHPMDAPSAWVDGPYPFDATYRFDIHDSAGTQVPWVPPPTVTAIDDVRSGTVEPGKSKDEEIDIQDFFNLNKAGSYVVRAKRRVSFKNPQGVGGITADLTRGDIESNEITITVVPPPKQEGPQ